MNFNIEQWRVQAYTAAVYQLSQQRMARIAGVCRTETFKGKSEYFDRMGLATAQKKLSRNSPTPNLDITLSRRMVTTSMYEWATLVDRKDKLLQIHDPENQFAQAGFHVARPRDGRGPDQPRLSATPRPAKAERPTSHCQTPRSWLACVSQGAIQLPERRGSPSDQTEV